MGMPELVIDVHELSKRFGDLIAVDGLELQVDAVRSTDSWAPTAAATPRRSACCAAC